MNEKGYVFSPEFLERLNTEFHSTGDIDLYELFDDYYVYLGDNYHNLNEHTSKMDYIYAAVALLKKNELAIPEGMIEDNLLHKDKAIKPDNKEGLDKENVIQILNAANDDRFKLYLTFLAASGWRAEEPLVLKWSDFWYVFDDHPQHPSKSNKQSKVFLNGKLSKT
jgi:integrase